MREIKEQRETELEVDHAYEPRIGHPVEPRFDPEFDSESHSEANLEIDPEDLRPRAWIQPERSRVLLVAGLLLGLVMMVVLPPLISVNRYRKQIATSISASLGRPVHMGSVTLNVLPLPGFTLENFVVSEDAAFGSEPVIQARSVRVRLRVWSLWRRRVEFSRISLSDPSVNLVRRADGRWNIESILLQASKIDVAPTTQKGAGEAPRFPYIEATGARVNVKVGLEKMPLALTEADFALWLPQPQQWRLRLEGHPTRTDVAPTDTGTLQVQGTLGKAATLQAMPIDLAAEWRAAPLGGLSWVLIGRDAGLRGDMTLRTNVLGTVGENAIDSHLELNEVRRSDFVPVHPLDALIACKANASAFHSLQGVDCAWLTGENKNGSPYGLTAQGDMPDVLHPGSANLEVRSFLPMSQLLNVLRVASNRIPAELTVAGWENSDVRCCGHSASSLVTGFQAEDVKLALGDAKPFVDGSVRGELLQDDLTLLPVALDLGGPQPAMLRAHADSAGYRMHLSGPVIRSRLMLLAKALPQFGDGLEKALPDDRDGGKAETPVQVDLASSRSWTGEQTWGPAVTVKPSRARKRSRR